MVVSSLALLASGCTPARTLGLKVQGLSPLNRNEQKQSTPVDMRVYLLRSREAFDKASVVDLWNKDQTILEKDLVGACPAMVITILPEEKDHDPRPFDVNLPEGAGKEARFVGFFVLYGSYAEKLTAKFEDGEVERKLVLPFDEAGKVTVRLTKYGISSES